MIDSRIARLKEIEQELDLLYKEQFNLTDSINEERRSQKAADAKRWGVSEGACFILFSKSDRGYHWDIAKTFKVTDVDFVNMYMNVIEASYHEADYEYMTRVETRRISFDSLTDIENDFNVYVSDEAQVALLNQHFCDLKLTYTNYKTYQEELLKNAATINSSNLS